MPGRPQSNDHLDRKPDYNVDYDKHAYVYTTLAEPGNITGAVVVQCIESEYVVWSIEISSNGSVFGGTSTQSDVVTTFNSTTLAAPELFGLRPL